MSQSQTVCQCVCVGCVGLVRGFLTRLDIRGHIGASTGRAVALAHFCDSSSEDEMEQDLYVSSYSASQYGTAPRSHLRHSMPSSTCPQVSQHVSSTPGSAGRGGGGGAVGAVTGAVGAVTGDVGAVTGAAKLAGGVGQHLDWGRRQSLGDGTCGHVHGTHAPAGEHHSQAYSDFV